MFVQSVEFIRAHATGNGNGGRRGGSVTRPKADISIYGQESNYTTWRETVGAGSEPAPTYHDIPGFCKSVTIDDIRKHGHVLTPGRYVGAAPQEDDGEPFEEKMKRLVVQLREQQAEAVRLDAEIAKNLKELGYG